MTRHHSGLTRHHRHHSGRHIWHWQRLGVWLTCALDEAVGFDNSLALLVGELAHRLEVVIEANHIIVKGLLQHAHGVFQSGNFDLELDKFLRQRVLWVDLGVDVVHVDRCYTLALIDDLLQLFVLLL